MYRNMLISVLCDCTTVKNVVTGNSSSKPDRTGRDGKFVKQSKMLNNSAYSRLGNKNYCFLTTIYEMDIRTLSVVMSHGPTGARELVSASSMKKIEAKMVNITFLPEVCLVGGKYFYTL